MYFDNGQEPVDFIRDTGIFPHLRGAELEKLVRDGNADLFFVLSFLGDTNSYMRSVAARCLGIMKTREAYSHLLRLMADHELYVRCDTILAMGESQDSRFTFPLINYYHSANYEEHKRIMIALSALKDPRAVCFLQDIIKRDDDIGELAREAYSACFNSEGFNYTFAGRDDLFADAKGRESRVLLDSCYVLEEDLQALADPSSRLLSYIVDKHGMFIGGLRDEHVFLARGGKVLSAGEISFSEVRSNEWAADYINNRSNGYYPDSSSFISVKKALEGAGISCGDRFTEVFPRCGFCDPEFLQDKPFYLPRITQLF